MISKFVGNFTFKRVVIGHFLYTVKWLQVLVSNTNNSI